jgi:hypothetical protein
MKFATAIRRIVEALQAPRNSLLNTFGMVALNECRACLYKYTKICQMVSNLDCFSWLGDELREYITCGSQGNLPAFHSTLNMEQSGILGDNLRNTPQFMQPASGMKFAARGLGVSYLSQFLFTFFISGFIDDDCTKCRYFDECRNTRGLLLFAAG